MRVPGWGVGGARLGGEFSSWHLLINLSVSLLGSSLAGLLAAGLGVLLTRWL